MNKEDWKYLKGEWKYMWDELWYFFIIFGGSVLLFMVLLVWQGIYDYKNAKMSDKSNGTEIVISQKE